MEESFIIGLAGPIGAGKDTVGCIFEKLTGFKRDSFAAPVRHIGEIFGVSGEDLRSQEGKQKVNMFGVTNRDLLRFIGTEMTKPTLGDDVWVRLLNQRIRGEHAVITDVRFPSEAEWVRSRGILVHIKRPDNPLAGEMSDHVSDKGLPFLKGDYSITNNGTVLDLMSRALTIIQHNDRLRGLANGYNETRFLSPF